MPELHPQNPKRSCPPLFPDLNNIPSVPLFAELCVNVGGRAFKLRPGTPLYGLGASVKAVHAAGHTQRPPPEEYSNIARFMDKLGHVAGSLYMEGPPND